MKFNNTAFTDINDKKYRNWDGYSLVYSYEFIKSIEPYLNFNDINVIFDIGSRDACQALELSDWFPESKIYLFEPVPSSFNFCVKNINNRDNIVCNELALSNFDGQATFYEVVNGNVGASSLLKVTPTYGHFQQSAINVNVKTAKSFLQENNIDKVDLLWVDVQGSEIECFSGFGEYLENVKAIHTEVGLQTFYENGTDFDNLMNFMEANNFEKVKVLGNEAGLEVDVIFINKKYINE